MATITGKLINPTAAGAGLASYPITVVPKTATAPSGVNVTVPVSAETESDSSGNFTLSLTGPGVYQVKCGYKPELIEFLLVLLDDTNQDIGDVTNFEIANRLYLLSAPTTPTTPVHVLYMRASNGVVVPVTIEAVSDGAGGYYYVPEVG